MRTLVIGYGNTLRGDDAIGPAVAEAVERCAGGAQVKIVHQLTPELALDLAQADRVIFVDASAGIPPGEVHVLAIDSQAAAATAERSHSVDPAWLLHITQALYGCCPQCIAVMVGAARFDLDVPLSTAARQGVAAATHRILQLLDQQPVA